MGKSSGRFLFVAIVPLLPLIGYVAGSTTPFSFYLQGLTPPQNLESRRTATTGSPVAAFEKKNGARRGPSPFTWKAIRKHAKRWTVKRLKVPRWRLALTENFAIRSDARIDDVRYAGVYLEKSLALMQKLLGGEKPEPRFSVRLFRFRKGFAGYAKVCGVPEADSFYNPRTREIVACRDEESPRRRLTSALLHELTHMYVHRVFEKTRPLWLTEGLAEYFSRYDISTGRLRVGLADVETLSRLRDSLETGDWLPIRRLMAMERGEFYGPDSSRSYAQAWLTVHSLMNEEDEKGLDFIRACLNGNEPRIDRRIVMRLGKRAKNHLLKFR